MTPAVSTESKRRIGFVFHDVPPARELAAHGSRTYAKDRTKTREYLNAFLICKDESLSALWRTKLDRLGIKHTHWFAATDSLHYIRLDTAHAERIAEQYGLHDPARERRVPDFIHRGGDAEVRQYIETYVSLRGECPNRYKLPRLHVSFHGVPFARDFQRLLSRMGVPAQLSIKPTGSAIQAGRCAI